jgi:HPt (histidine-containing phosphotransfer) domain-containing protein
MQDLPSDLIPYIPLTGVLLFWITLVPSLIKKVHSRNQGIKIIELEDTSQQPLSDVLQVLPLVIARISKKEREIYVSPIDSEKWLSLTGYPCTSQMRINEFLRSFLSVDQADYIHDHLYPFLHTDTKITPRIETVEKVQTTIPTGVPEWPTKQICMEFYVQDPKTILMVCKDITVETQSAANVTHATAIGDGNSQRVARIIKCPKMLLERFIEDAEYHLQTIRIQLKKTNAEKIKKIQAELHSLKGGALLFNFSDIVSYIHRAELIIKQTPDALSNTRSSIIFSNILLEIIDTVESYHKALREIETFSTQQDLSFFELLEIQSIQYLNSVSLDSEKKAHLRFHVTNRGSIPPKPFLITVQAIIPQLLKNAFLHGIETPTERLKKGKDPQGLIEITIELEVESLNITCRDDGQGFNFKKIQKQLLMMGAIEDGCRIDQREILSAMIRGNFSTFEAPTLHGGMGVGLSTVYMKAKQLGGTLSLSSNSSKGTTIVVKIPTQMESVESKQSISETTKTN